MSAASNATMDRSTRHRWGPCGSGSERQGNWSGLNIAAMVAGFVFFWPVGLALLYWNVTGRDVRELPDVIRRQWSALRGGRGLSASGYSDNTVFNDFQQTQHDRIREIKEEIRERSRRFGEFRAAARRRADEEEFNRFMASAPEQPKA